MIKISFDFDGSLDRESLQKYAMELISKEFEIWIVTARFSNTNDYCPDFLQKFAMSANHKDLFTVADQCGISIDHIKFMNMAPKYEFFFENEDFLWHLDDDYVECREINQDTKTVGISCANGSNWIAKCERLINKKLKI